MTLSDCVIFRGLRVRMGVAGGPATEVRLCATTGAAEYVGPLVDKCARLCACAYGGQVLVDKCAQESLVPYVLEDLSIKMTLLGKFQLKEGEEVYQVSETKTLFSKSTFSYRK